MSEKRCTCCGQREDAEEMVARLRESWRGMQGALHDAECEVAELRAALAGSLPPPGDGAGGGED